MFSVLAQQAPTTLEGWADRLGKFGKSIPQEQVFVHTDNTCYFLGDTIYYKAYVRRSDTGDAEPHQRRALRRTAEPGRLPR